MPVVMDMDVLIPFVVIAGLTLAIFIITKLMDSYEAPTSAQDSVKQIFISTGGWMAGLIVGRFVSEGFEASEEVWATVLGALAAFIGLFTIDMTVLYARSRRRAQSAQDE